MLHRWKIVVVFAVCLLAGSCHRPNVEPIRIGYSVWPGYEPLYLAQELKFFEKHGVRVRLIDFDSFTDILRAYQKGRVEGAAMTMVELLRMPSTLDPPVAVLAIDASAGADGIVARPSIKRVQDLRGRKVGVEMGALGAYTLGRALDGAGLALSDVITINMTPDIEGTRAFREGTIDALVTFEPTLSELEREFGAKKIFSSREIPEEIIDVLTFSRTILKSRPDDCRRILAAWFEAIQYWAEHPREADEIMSRREQATPPKFRDSLRGLQVFSLQDNRRFFETGGQRGSLDNSAERVSDFLLRLHLISARPDLGARFDGSLIRSLAEKRP